MIRKWMSGDEFENSDWAGIYSNLTSFVRQTILVGADKFLISKKNLWVSSKCDQRQLNFFFFFLSVSHLSRAIVSTQCLVKSLHTIQWWLVLTPYPPSHQRKTIWREKITRISHYNLPMAAEGGWLSLVHSWWVQHNRIKSSSYRISHAIDIIFVRDCSQCKFEYLFPLLCFWISFQLFSFTALVTTILGECSWITITSTFMSINCQHCHGLDQYV